MSKRGLRNRADFGQAYNVSWAQIGEYVKRGLVSSCRVQEIGSVDIHKAMFVNDTIPVFLVACEVQEINAWKSAKTGKVMIGAEDVIQRTRYAMALTMVEAELDNELTGGWKISEVSTIMDHLACAYTPSVC